jgi:hypothetical protein
MMKHKKFILAILAGIIGVGFYLIITGSYPVAFVDWHPITLKSFKKDYAMAFVYYRKSLETYDKDQLPVLDSSDIQREIKRTVLEQLIQNSLIRQELEKQMKSKDLKKMIDNKIQEALKGKDIEKQVKTLFGLSLDAFKESVLKPQAEKEILNGRLFLENKNFDDWLKELEVKAKITVLLSDLEWKNGEVVLK